MHVIISGIGSAGDVNPIIEIGRELLSLDHPPIYSSCIQFRQKVNETPAPRKRTCELLEELQAVAGQRKNRGKESSSPR